jgi:uncharacterized protein with NRDE domain
MCLLIFAWQVDPSFPLVVAANRDERLDRPATSFSVLRQGGPRVLGGRDDLAGGTWLAVNQHGVVAGLTNRPAAGGRDPSKRSRGELPLLAAGQTSAEAGVAQLLRQVQPGQYNLAWLLVGDRRSLYYVTLGPDEAPTVVELSPGIHVLENVPLGAASAKVDRIRTLLPSPATGPSLWSALPAVLADHTLPTPPDPPGDVAAPAGASAVDAAVPPRPRETQAACVHTDGYGTRSATLVRVPEAATGLPQMLVADGPPCTTPFVDVSDRWAG